MWVMDERDRKCIVGKGLSRKKKKTDITGNTSCTRWIWKTHQVEKKVKGRKGRSVVGEGDEREIPLKVKMGPKENELHLAFHYTSANLLSERQECHLLYVLAVWWELTNSVEGRAHSGLGLTYCASGQMIYWRSRAGSWSVDQPWAAVRLWLSS